VGGVWRREAMWRSRVAAAVVRTMVGARGAGIVRNGAAE